MATLKADPCKTTRAASDLAVAAVRASAWRLVRSSKRGLADRLALVGVPFIAALTLWVLQRPDGAHQTLFAWLPQFVFGLQLDRISLVWTMIITGVGFLIHVTRSATWPREGLRAILCLPEFLHLCDAHAGTLRQLRRNAGRWGLVGLASYLLIGYYFERPTAVLHRRRRSSSTSSATSASSMRCS